MDNVRYYIVKDAKIVGWAATKDNAVDMIREYQKLETHYLLKAEFSVIEGKLEEFIKYE